MAKQLSGQGRRRVFSRREYLHKREEYLKLDLSPLQLLGQLSLEPDRPYKYTPLATEDSIRLIKILAGAADEILQCKLIVVNFSDEPKFEALSYTWGAPIFSRKLEEVSLEPTTLRITDNLCDALLALRDLDEDRSLWVDAVCINQKDDSEKAIQVAMMKDIYQKAQRVIVWLGKQSDDLKLAELEKKGFGELEGIGRSCSSYGFDKVFPPFPRDIKDRPAYERFQQLAQTADGHALSRVYSQEWFTRVWIVQEFVLARDLIMQFGNLSLTYDIFSKATAVLQLMIRRPGLQADINQNQNAMMMPFMMPYHFNEAWQLIMQRERYWGIDATAFPNRTLGQAASSQARSVYAYEDQYIRPSSIIEYCAFARNLRCTMEVDRIYGMLGFAHDDLELMPDYSSTPKRIWEQLAHQTLLSGDLTVLHYAGLPYIGESRVKSFAADFGNLKIGGCQLGGHGHPRFHAATQLPAKVEDEHGLVRIHAIKVDTVNQVIMIGPRNWVTGGENGLPVRFSPHIDQVVIDLTGKRWQFDRTHDPLRVKITQAILNQLDQWWTGWYAALGPRYYSKSIAKWALSRTIIADNKLPVSGELFGHFDLEILDLLFVLSLLVEDRTNHGGETKMMVDTWKVYERIGKPMKFSIARFLDDEEGPTSYYFPTFSAEDEINDTHHALLEGSSFEEVAYWDQEFSQPGNRIMATLGVSNPSLSSKAKTIEITDHLKEQLNLYTEAVSTILAHRHVFFTNCRLLGIGPAGMQAGDVIMVPEGAQTPFVYRPVDDGGDAGPGGYTRYGYLVGECYIHELMDGDPVEQLTSDYHESHIEVVLV